MTVNESFAHAIVLIPCKETGRETNAQDLDAAGGAGEFEPDQLRLQRHPDQ
jgi:hypothetical protein